MLEQRSDTSLNNPYYVPSGRIPIAVIPISILGALAALASAWGYAWMTWQGPLLGDCLVALVFSAMLGFAVIYIAKKAKVRSPKWMGRIGILIGLLAWYAQWAAYLCMTADLPGKGVYAVFLALLADPLAMAELILALTHTGAYDAFGLSLPSGLIIATWVAELGTLVLFPYLFGRNAATEPFCERSNSWMKEVTLPCKFSHVNASADLVQLLETRPDHLFSVLEPCQDEQQPNYAIVKLHHGQEDVFVSISNVEVEAKGRTTKENINGVIFFLRVPGISAAELGEKMTKLAAGPVSTAEPTARTDPPELARAIHLLDAQQFDGVLDAAAPYITAERSDLRLDANRLCALATARLGRWPQSLDYWKALFDDECTAHNALQIATSSAMSGNMADAEQWMKKTREINEETRELSGMQILTNYVTALGQAGQANAALPYLEDIREIYVQVKSTDPTHLYMSRLPLFHVFLNNSAPVVRAALGPDKSRDWYLWMLPHLDEHGKVTLNDWLEDQSAQTVE